MIGEHAGDTKSYYENTYDPNSPVEQYKRERSRVNVLITGLEPDLDPNPKSCKWCHEVLIPLPDDSTKLFCQGCGCKYPAASSNSDLDTNKSVTSNAASDTKPKESKSKLKQKR